MKIGVIGLGYVGLTFSVVAASKGIEVLALENSDYIKRKLNNKKAHFFEPGLDDLINALFGSKLVLKEKFTNSDNIEIFFITVGTPLLKNSNVPNYEYLKSALDSISEVYDGNQLIILRSTIAVGTTKKIVIPYLSKFANIAEDKVLVAFCPERTIEGRAIQELQELPQIIGADNKEALILAENLFRQITNTVIKIDSLEAAELIKLFNNTYRDVHFAIGNVFNEIAQGYGIDGVELIKIANLGYSRSNIALPGFVGGPCLEKDAYILTENMGDSSGKEFVLNSRKYNESLEDSLVNWVLQNIDTKEKICITGLAFKGVPETSDLRGSSSINIIKKLNRKRYFPNLHDFVAYEKEVIEQVQGTYYTQLDQAIFNCKALIILNNNVRYSRLDITHLLKQMQNGNVYILDYWSTMNNSSIQLYKNINYINAGNILIKK